MTSTKLVARRIVAGTRMAARMAADERRHQSFDDFLRDKRDFGDQPTMFGPMSQLWERP